MDRGRKGSCEWGDFNRLLRGWMRLIAGLVLVLIGAVVIAVIGLAYHLVFK